MICAKHLFDYSKAEMTKTAASWLLWLWWLGWLGSAAAACPGGGFDCGNGTCVPLSAKCDGRKDCYNGVDELYCLHGQFHLQLQSQFLIRIQRGVSGLRRVHESVSFPSQLTGRSLLSSDDLQRTPAHRGRCRAGTRRGTATAPAPAATATTTARSAEDLLGEAKESHLRSDITGP